MSEGILTYSTWDWLVANPPEMTGRRHIRVCLEDFPAAWWEVAQAAEKRAGRLRMDIKLEGVVVLPENAVERRIE